ncbi:hypothetical protein GDO86_014061 [Hymenochirus boettgeri]|uniref:Uncharacterized protein n=1 Tax=Hymenochirus boettgeri TaxID=247094 RepID=A0A8T2JSY8_9PIPI|nr:hypothetical protein GDO86_014061 [Hymenochirus boettgeri]
MNGFNFSLLAQTDTELPDILKQSQEIIKKLSQATKLLISNQTRLGEIVFTVLHSQSKSEMITVIKGANTTHLDQVRLEGNLEENLKTIDKVRQLSKEYEEDAYKILKEVAETAGADI